MFGAVRPSPQSGLRALPNNRILYQSARRSHHSSLPSRRAAIAVSSRPAQTRHALPRLPQSTQYEPSTQTRSFVSSPFQPEIQTIQATRTLSYPKAPLYELIADVGSYSKFLPYCQESTVTSWSEPDQDGKRWPREAELKVGWGGIEEKFTSKVYCSPVGDVVEAVAGEAETSIPKNEMTHYDVADDSHPSSSSNPSSTSSSTSSSTPSGPLFSHLLTRWTIRSFPYKPPPTLPNAAVVPDQSTKHASREQSEVGLEIEFQFVNPVYGGLSKAVAPKLAGVMIEAFEKRARGVLDGAGTSYGK
ncbi:MAG: hypothetical protein M4579_003294 [Chaenotheca gracillima]|nr:MAG: hypothetical protein M4579_003294 [Chaenotheca gracillima]